MRSKILMREGVRNAERRFGSAGIYYPATVITGAGPRPALFTATELDSAMARAALNPEDVPRRRWWWPW